MSNITQDLDRIAHDIDALGVGANETAIAMVVDRAWMAAVNPVLLSVLSDTTEPKIARARAFGMVATALAAAGHRPTREPVGSAEPQRSHNGVTLSLHRAVVDGADLKDLVH
jgi:hypothetical protein